MHLLYVNHTSCHSGLNWAVHYEQMHHAWGEPVEVIGDVPLAYTKMSQGSSNSRQFTVSCFKSMLLLTVGPVDCRACEMQVQKELRLRTAHPVTAVHLFKTASLCGAHNK